MAGALQNMIIGLLVVCIITIAMMGLYLDMANTYGTDINNNYTGAISRMNGTFNNWTSTTNDMQSQINTNTSLTLTSSIDTLFGSGWSILKGLPSIAANMIDIMNQVAVDLGIPSMFVGLASVVIMLTLIFAILYAIFRVQV